MYLHIGQDSIVRTADVVGLFDLDQTTVSKLSRDFLQCAEREGRTTTVSAELPKSFILCAAPRKKPRRAGQNPAKPAGAPDKIYISQISVPTLKKRLAKPYSAWQSGEN